MSTPDKSGSQLAAGEVAIRAELERVDPNSRWLCDVCGNHSEQAQAMAEVAKSHPTHAAFRVCGGCIKRGDIDGHLNQRAAELEQQAARLRAVVGRLQIPMVDEWQRVENSGSFGGCPVCLGDDGYLNDGPNHYFFCSRHKTAWCAGSNLFSCWREESETDWQRNRTELAQFKLVEPCPVSGGDDGELPFGDDGALPFWGA